MADLAGGDDHVVVGVMEDWVEYLRHSDKCHHLLVGGQCVNAFQLLFQAAF